MDITIEPVDSICRDSTDTAIYDIYKTEMKEKHFGRFAAFWFGTFVMLSCATRGLVENTPRWMVHCYKRFGEIFMHCHILRVHAIPTYSLPTP